MRDTAGILEDYNDQKKHPRREWTEERIAELKQGVFEGLSASVIATRIGVTRNAVIGKVHRLGLQLSRHQSTVERKMRHRAAIRQKVQPALIKKMQEGRMRAGHIFTGAHVGESTAYERARMERAAIAANTAPNEALMIPLLDLEPHHCRWPIGDPGKPGFGFCGCERAPVGSYCETHAQINRRASVPSGEPISSFYGYRRKVA